MEELMDTKKVLDYIVSNWAKTIRRPDDVIHGNIRIPFPFTVPDAEDTFTDFYYWDTYFHNIGLILSGREEQAENNLDVMKFFVGLLGYVPNANHITDRSQPPLFTRGVFDLYKTTGDKAVILRYIDALLKEHDFFVTKRTLPCGLCAYSTAMTDDELLGNTWLFDRVGEPVPEKREDVIRMTRNLFAIAESGWDFNPRFDTPEGRFRADEFIHLDLNCLLFDAERKISFMLREIGRNDDADAMAELASERKELIEKYLHDPVSGLYLDYNFVREEFSSVVSAVSFYPYFSGISNDFEGALKVLSRLELPHGVATCEERPGAAYLQWDFPAMWPSNVYFTVAALESAGLPDDARRIAYKYVGTATRVFEKTGCLWEKYDALTAEVSVTNEYRTPKMLGWTAGVYQFMCAKYGF